MADGIAPTDENGILPFVRNPNKQQPPPATAPAAVPKRSVFDTVHGNMFPQGGGGASPTQRATNLEASGGFVPGVKGILGGLNFMKPINQFLGTQVGNQEAYSGIDRTVALPASSLNPARAGKPSATAQAVKDGVNQGLDNRGVGVPPPATPPPAPGSPAAPNAPAAAQPPAATPPAATPPAGTAAPAGPDPYSQAPDVIMPSPAPTSASFEKNPELKPFDNKAVDTWIEGEVTSGRMTREQSWLLQRGRGVMVDPRNFKDADGNFDTVGFKRELRQADETFAPEERNEALKADQDYQVRSRDAHHMIGKAQSLMNSPKPWLVNAEAQRMMDTGYKDLADAEKSATDNYFKVRAAEDAEYLEKQVQSGQLSADRRKEEAARLADARKAEQDFINAQNTWRLEQQKGKMAKDQALATQKLQNEGRLAEQGVQSEALKEAARIQAKGTVDAAGVREQGKPLTPEEMESYNYQLEDAKAKMSEEDFVRFAKGLAEQDPRLATYFKGRYGRSGAAAPAAVPGAPAKPDTATSGIAPTVPDSKGGKRFPFKRKDGTVR